MVSVIKNTERVGGCGWRGAANGKLRVHEMATYTANYRQSSAAKPYACLVLNRREREKNICKQNRWSFIYCIQHARNTLLCLQMMMKKGRKTIKINECCFLIAALEALLGVK